MEVPGHNSLQLKPLVHVQDVPDIEENIWSPMFGLKGKIDATLRVRASGPWASSQVQDEELVPFELKTGKCQGHFGSVSHRAQVLLYTLLLSDRYRCRIRNGMLPSTSAAMN